MLKLFKGVLGAALIAFSISSTAGQQRAGGLGVGNGGGNYYVKGGFLNGLFEDRRQMVSVTQRKLLDLENGLDPRLKMAMNLNKCRSYEIKQTEISQFHELVNKRLSRQKIYSYTNVWLKNCRHDYHFGDVKPKSVTGYNKISFIH